MLAVLEGLTTIGVVVLVGYLLARTSLLPESTPEVLSTLVFFVATPALLLKTLAEAPIQAVLSRGLAVTCLATTVAARDLRAARPAVVEARRRHRGDRLAGVVAMSMPETSGSPWLSMFSVTPPIVAPVMLYQLVVLAPIAFVVLDMVESGHRPSWRRVLIQPIRNPVIIASVLGIVLAATGTAIPELINAPLTLIAGMAVPGALIAFGISLRGAPLPGRGGRAADLAAATGLKIVLMPLVAFALARWVFGMTRRAAAGGHHVRRAAHRAERLRLRRSVPDLGAAGPGPGLDHDAGLHPGADHHRQPAELISTLLGRTLLRRLARLAPVA